MSRSNPTDSSPNPAERWFEWNGAEGNFRYWDKEKEQRVDVKLPFTFLVLDQLCTVKGWHEPSESGIYSNEVRDTREQGFSVRSFKGGPLTAGLYAQVKDRIAAAGGHFVVNCYVAFKDGGALKLGSVQFKGASLSAWFEFRKAHRKAIYEQAVSVKSFAEGQKGKVKFRTPVFDLVKVSDKTNADALALDQQLQAYLAEYFARTQKAALTAAPTEEPQPDAPTETVGTDEPPLPEEPPDTVSPDADDIPY